jgi:hypothetical protein
MSFDSEFKSVNLLVESDLPTKMVDAFSLSLIKAERQMRKIFTFLAFQNDLLDSSNVNGMREKLTERRRVYFEGFILGIDEMAVKPLAELYGENYGSDLEKIKLATIYRNKIFHGQLTDAKLSQEDLETQVTNIKSWCKNVAEVCLTNYGYCGFGRGSFKKSSVDLSDVLHNPVTSIEEYEQFILKHMCR